MTFWILLFTRFSRCSGRSVLAAARKMLLRRVTRKLSSQTLRRATSIIMRSIINTNTRRRSLIPKAIP
jgi:hypothetical protein